jgi:hypothetical protein
MNPQGGFTGALSPDAVQTEIDGVAYETYERKSQPNAVSAKSSSFFKNTNDNKLAYTWDEDSNVGGFVDMDEQEEFTDVDTFIGNTKTVKQQKRGKQIPVSLEAFKADQVGKRAKIGSQMGDRAELTQTRTALLDTYADAFAGSITTTPDGDCLASASHTTLKGYNVDNLETAELDADGMWTLVQNLANMQAQDGEAGSYTPSGLLVPFILMKTSHETLDAELAPFGGENQPNIFSTVYGALEIGASIFLGSTYNAATNANTSYHLVSNQHTISRKVFMDLSTSLIPPENTANDSWIYRGRFFESHFAETFAGFAASSGTT